MAGAGHLRPAGGRRPRRRGRGRAGGPAGSRPRRPHLQPFPRGQRPLPGERVCRPAGRRGPAAGGCRRRGPGRGAVHRRPGRPDARAGHGRRRVRPRLPPALRGGPRADLAAGTSPARGLARGGDPYRRPPPRAARHGPGPGRDGQGLRQRCRRTARGRRCRLGRAHQPRRRRRGRPRSRRGSGTGRLAGRCPGDREGRGPASRGGAGRPWWTGHEQHARPHLDEGRDPPPPPARPADGASRRRGVADGLGDGGHLRGREHRVHGRRRPGTGRGGLAGRPQDPGRLVAEDGTVVRVAGWPEPLVIEVGR